MTKRTGGEITNGHQILELSIDVGLRHSYAQVAQIVSEQVA